MAKEVFEMNVGCCARCGQDHLKVVVRRFVGEIPRVYTHWAMCPVTNHPIPVEIVDDMEEQRTAQTPLDHLIDGAPTSETLKSEITPMNQGRNTLVEVTNMPSYGEAVEVLTQKKLELYRKVAYRLTEEGRASLEEINMILAEESPITWRPSSLGMPPSQRSVAQNALCEAYRQACDAWTARSLEVQNLIMLEATEGELEVMTSQIVLGDPEPETGVPLFDYEALAHEDNPLEGEYLVLDIEDQWA